MEETLQLELPVLLPATGGQCPMCAERLMERISEHKGIEKVHLKEEGSQIILCFHYNPDLITLGKLKRLAEETGSQISSQYRHETLHVTGMDCTDCAMSIEHIMSRADGIIDISVNYAAEKMKVEYDTSRIAHEDIIQRVKWMGYGVEEKARENWFRENWEFSLSLLAGFFLATGFLGENVGGLTQNAAIGLYFLAYISGGYNATRHAVKAAFHVRFDIDVLMVVAALGAALVGEWAEGALLLFLFSLGHALEHYAMDRARHAIQSLGEITPKTARMRRNGLEKEISVEELLRGDVVIVRPGERIPIDGMVAKGVSSADQSPITGESVPVEKFEGEKVFAGTVNGSGALEIEVTKLAKDTTLARVIELVEEAQTQKSTTQRFTERLERTFVPLILGGVLILILVPPLVGLLPWEEAFIRAMTILVAASPCALAIATPSAVLSGIAQAARNGILIKGGVHLENLGELKSIAFDKTGTITRGVPEVTDIYPLEGGCEELLRTAAAVESRSGHPLAQAILRKAQEMGLDLPKIGDVQSVIGRGVISELEGDKVQIGNLKLFEGETGPQFEVASRKAQEFEMEGKTCTLVKRGGRILGCIALADGLREDARFALTRLRSLGIESLIMITGDNELTASAVGREVEIDDLRASLLPEEKVSAIEDLLEKYGKVAMIGDGVNDAPALARATVGIAMGASGTDVALETADVALMADDLSKLPSVVALSRESRRIIRQNLIISLGVIALLVLTALFGFVGMGIAIVLHEGSTLLVVANALRLLRFPMDAT